MENEDILEQQTILQERRKEMAQEELQKLKEGYSYNTPDSALNEPTPDDIDSKIVDKAEQVLTQESPVGQQPQQTQPTTTPNPVLEQKKPKHLLDFHSDMELDMNPATWAYLGSMGALDVPFDIVGLVPGLKGVDDTWDEITRNNNEGARKFRAAASVILPTILTAGAYGKFVGASKLPALTKAVANVGGVGLINGSIASVSDFGENPENRFLTSPQNFKRLQEWFPEIFGPQGRYPVSEDLMKIDGIDPELNRLLVGIDETILSGVGDIIGYAFNASKPLLWKFKPLNKKAKNFKVSNQLQYMERDTKNVIADIDEVLGSGTLGEEQAKNLLAKKAQLIDQVTKTGYSEATGNPAESIIRDKQRSRQAYRDSRALRNLAEEQQKLETERSLFKIAKLNPVEASGGTGTGLFSTRSSFRPDFPTKKWNMVITALADVGISGKEIEALKIGKVPPNRMREIAEQLRQVGGSTEDVSSLGFKLSDEIDGLAIEQTVDVKAFNPDITPKLASETQQTEKAFIPGAAVRNTLDVTAQEMGEHSRNAVPTAPYTEAMREKGLVLGKSHHMVADIAKKVRESGKYADFQDKWRSGVRSQAAWNIYEKIMKPGTGEQLAQVLSDPKYLRKETLLNEVLGDAEVQYLNPQATEAAAIAISDLLDVYLGRETQETSARVMSTLGKEISAISNASVTFKGLMDDDVVFKNIMDRVELLEAEFGKSKYVAGWTLQNLKWWKRWKKGNPAELAQMTFEEFNRNATKVHSDFKVFRENLEKAKAENPRLAQTLKEAYDYTDGDINSIRGLNQWAKEQINPGGLIYSGKRGMNLFAKGAWAVTYNNVLSGLSPLRAAVGNGSMLILKPLTTLTRAGVRSILKRDIEPIERVMYLHGSIFETTRRAFSDMTARMAKVHSDPDFMMKAIRKDFVVEEDNAYKIIEDFSEQWKKEGDLKSIKSQFFYGWAKLNRSMARMKWMRMGMTGMAGVDAFTDTFMATFNSRVRSYDDVFGRYGKTIDPEIFSQQLKQAEELNYSKMFDKNGLLTDEAAKNASGEIALNLDDGIADALNPWLTKVPALKTFMMFPRTGINQVKQSLSYLPMGKIPGWNSKYTKVLKAGDDIELIKEALSEHGIKNFDETPNAMTIYKQLKDEYEGRMMIGSATAIMGFWYAMSGGIRGNGPTNSSERQDLMRKGWRPYTVKIGNNWVSYKGIPMVEQMFALVGDIAYNQTALGTNMTTQLLDKLGWTISATYLNNTPLYGIEPFMAVMNGDEAAFKRLLANIGRGAIPQSGTFGVIANGITQAQKDIYDDFLGYVLNSTPLKPILPSQRDHWTGEKIREIDNHFLRILNAASPIKVSGGEEPWRLWLLNSGFDDIGILKKKYNKDVEYTAEEREVIAQFMGEDQLWKEVEKMRTNERWNAELDGLRQFINDPSKSAQEIKDYRNRLPVYRHLTKILKKSQRKAEARIALDPRYKHLDIQGTGKAMTKKYMEKGLIEKAKKNADTNQRINELLELPK